MKVYLYFGDDRVLYLKLSLDKGEDFPNIIVYKNSYFVQDNYSPGEYIETEGYDASNDNIIEDED